ncbi:hypothetical protein ACH419_42165 [Streptomyces bobili]
MVVWPLLPTSWVIAIPLSKLAAAWRVLHNAERRSSVWSNPRRGRPGSGR